MERILINETEIGPNFPTYFIAEIGSNFDGDLSRAKHLIDLAKESGADAVKFQHYTASELINPRGFDIIGEKKSHQATWQDSVFETYDRASLNSDWTEELAAHSKAAGITFLTSPYSLRLFKLVSPFVPAFKIGSGDISYIELIENMAREGKPILLATGASSFDEVERAVNAIQRLNNQLCIMQCNTNYENSDEIYQYLNLGVISLFKKKFPATIIGFSDHSKGHQAVLGAIALGARVIEKHFTDDPLRPGPDHGFAVDPLSWKAMIKDCRILEASLGDGEKRIESNEEVPRVVQRRAICLKNDCPEGHLITEDDLDYLRPLLKGSFHPYEKHLLIGRRFKRPMKRHEVITNYDIF